jgi:protein gp37
MDEIVWEIETWNPLRGCEVIEAESSECYAERLMRFIMAKRDTHQDWRDEHEN